MKTILLHIIVYLLIYSATAQTITFKPVSIPATITKKGMTNGKLLSDTSCLIIQSDSLKFKGGFTLDVVAVFPDNTPGQFAFKSGTLLIKKDSVMRSDGFYGPSYPITPAPYPNALTYYRFDNLNFGCLNLIPRNVSTTIRITYDATFGKAVFFVDGIRDEVRYNPFPTELNIVKSAPLVLLKGCKGATIKSVTLTQGRPVPDVPFESFIYDDSVVISYPYGTQTGQVILLGPVEKKRSIPFTVSKRTSIPLAYGEGVWTVLVRGKGYERKGRVGR